MSEHTHEHGHEHHYGDASPEETLALLNYMLGHNKEHTEELHDLAHNVPGEAHEKLHAAVDAYERGNEKLAEALRILNGEG